MMRFLYLIYCLMAYHCLVIMEVETMVVAAVVVVVVGVDRVVAGNMYEGILMDI